MMKHANEKWTPNGWVFDEEAAREDWSRARVDEDGIIRWKSNGAVPFDDMLYDFRCLGLIDDVTERRSNECRSKENDISLAKYRESMKDYKPSGEELFEMRAAFGPGATVVDVLTGKKIKL